LAAPIRSSTITSRQASLPYSNDLRIVFLNPHNGGGGTYFFEAGASGVITGYIAQGFDMIFSASELTQLRVRFMSLA
jgi:hypothetical protein